MSLGRPLQHILKSDFASTCRPIHKSDTFIISARICTVEFQITECEPAQHCWVTPSTEIHTEASHSSARRTTRRTQASTKSENVAASWTSSASSSVQELVGHLARCPRRPSLESRMLSCKTSTFARWTRRESDIDHLIESSDLGDTQTRSRGKKTLSSGYIRRTGARAPRRRSAPTLKSTESSSFYRHLPC
jgi:hypothetical protein